MNFDEFKYERNLIHLIKILTEAILQNAIPT